MKIGLFGGSFDPPHLAHQALVTTVLTKGLFDQIWYVPVVIHQPAFASLKADMSRLADRLAMLELIHQPRTRIERYEIDSEQPSYTHRTLRVLASQHPQHTYSFIMGSDQLSKLHLWRCDQDRQCFPQAASEFAYYVYPRVGYLVNLPYPNLRLIEGVAPLALSSTQIRDLVKQGRSITGLVDPGVEQYIQQQKK